MDKNKIISVAESCMEGTDLFLVDVKVSPTNEIEVVVDSDSRVSIEQCISLSKAIEAEFDREAEDFELTVISSGIGQPLKLMRQFNKIKGRPVEVLLLSGIKVKGILSAFDENGVEVTFETKLAVEGKKRKVLTEVTERHEFNQIKTVAEELVIK